MTSSGTVTPSAAPSSTPVGVSTPRRIRDRAITAMITAAAQPPRRRHGPGGTSVYSAPARTAQMVSIATEGSAKPPQRLERHPERERPVHSRQEDRRQQDQELVAEEQDQQVPEPAEHDQRQ
jgi:hypothetical protein